MTPMSDEFQPPTPTRQPSAVDVWLDDAEERCREKVYDKTGNEVMAAFAEWRTAFVRKATYSNEPFDVDDADEVFDLGGDLLDWLTPDEAKRHHALETDLWRRSREPGGDPYRETYPNLTVGERALLALERSALRRWRDDVDPADDDEQDADLAVLDNAELDDEDGR